MKNIILAICTTSLLALFAPTSYACFCAVPDLPKAYEQAIAVFVGEVVGIVPPPTSDEKAPFADRLYTIKFKVEKSWKGVSSSEISVLSGNGKGGCLSYPAVHLGRKYLVYGDAVFPNGVPAKGQMVITTCNRTALIPAAANQTRAPLNWLEFDRQDASQDLKALERLSFMTVTGISNRVPHLSSADPERSVNRAGCAVIDKGRSAQFISYEGGEPASEVTLRIHNNTGCSIIVETDDKSPTRLNKPPNGGVAEVVTKPQDSVSLALHYLVQDRKRWRAAEPGYGWGDSVFTYKLLPGQSAVFTVSRNHFRKRFDILVPFNYACEANQVIGMGVGGMVHRVYFLADDLPELARQKK